MNDRKHDLVFLYPMMIFFFWICWSYLDGVREEAAKPTITGPDNSGDVEDAGSVDGYGKMLAKSVDEGFDVAQMHVESDYAEDVSLKNYSIMALWLYGTMADNSENELAQTPINDIRANDASHLLCVDITLSALRDDICMRKLDVTIGSGKEDVTLSVSSEVEDLTLADVFFVSNLNLTDSPGVLDDHSADGYHVNDITFLAHALGNVCIAHEGDQSNQTLDEDGQREMDKDKFSTECDGDDDVVLIQPDCRKSTDIPPGKLHVPLMKTLIIGTVIVAPAAVLSSCGYCPMVDD